MIQLKRTFVCMLPLLAVQAGSTPIATSQIVNNLPSAMAVFEYGVGGGSAVNSGAISTSYLRLETEEIAPRETFFEGDGIALDNVTGVFAIAESNNVTVLNRAQTSPFQGAANSTSSTATRLYYNVENVQTVTFTLDMTTSVDLLTEASDESAYGFVEQYLDLYWFDKISGRYTALDGDYFFFEWEVVDGDSYTETASHQLNLLYDFDNTPFTGQLLFEGTASSYTDAEAPINVPEPGILSLFILGMGLLAGTRIVYKRNAR
jgi:hypothetical protein